MIGGTVPTTGVEKIQGDARLIGLFVLSLWVILFLDHWVFRQGIRKALGIKPRQRFNLATIFFSPLVHGSSRHLLGNSIPLAILAFLTVLPDTQLFWPVTGIITLVDGLGTWYFGRRDKIHIGASGLLMGYFGFVLTRGFFHQDTGAVLFAFVVAGFYASLFKVLVLRQEGISYASHLSGFAGGLAAAYVTSLF